MQKFPNSGNEWKEGMGAGRVKTIGMRMKRDMTNMVGEEFPHFKPAKGKRKRKIKALFSPKWRQPLAGRRGQARGGAEGLDRPFV